MNSRVKLCMFLLAGCTASAAQAATEYRYTMLFSGRASGEHITRIADDGSIATDFSYRDNGRGPDYKENLTLAGDGTLRRFAITGKSTFGSLVDERFERKGDRAEWAGKVDRGSMKISGKALYVPIESTIEVTGIMVRALIHESARKLPGIPGGELSIVKLSDTNVTNGKESRALTLYAVRGADLEPNYVWMTADGERAFATIFPGFAQLILKGWETQADALEKLQLQAQAAYQRDIAKRDRHELPQPVLIKNARVFDSEHAVLGPAQDVYVNHGRIGAVYPAGSPSQTPGTVIDAKGRTLLPGLFDMHAHVSPGDYLLNLASGVTTVRDMGNDNAVLADAIGRLDRHESIGPHVVPAGFIEGKSQFNANGGILVDSLDAAKQAVDFYAQRGYPQIKIYNSFKPEWVKETAAYAHQRGMRVSGHIPAFMKAEDAVKDGYDEIQHINQVLLNFYVKPDTDTRSLQRFTLIAENANSLDLDAQPFQNLVKLFVAHKTVLDPTLTAFEAQFTQMPGEMNPSLAAIGDHLPITLHRQLFKSESEITKEMAPRWRASFAKMLAAVASFHRAGLQIVSGTDDVAGFAYQRELELYVKAGIPANEVLRIATWNGATYARVLADRGSIERGKRADLILIDGDPTQDISTIRNVALVMQDGDAYYPAELWGELGVKLFAPALMPEQGAVPRH
ncbi:MAG TPA: amidohydrolase family protein [Steroidobacteraceae bacterium]|nr:amidohydrolase family protein [Steroidobacteraceae bacterium]